MNKFQEIRNLITFENVGGSTSTFWVKAKHSDGDIRCLSVNIKARKYIEGVDLGIKSADRTYSAYVKAIWEEVCSKSGKPTTLPLIIKSLQELANAMNNKVEFDYNDLLKRGFIQDIADYTDKYICRRKGSMIVKNEAGKFTCRRYDEEKIANHLKAFVAQQK